jgi:predicted transcriptional regulator
MDNRQIALIKLMHINGYKGYRIAKLLNISTATAAKYVKVAQEAAKNVNVIR